MPEKLNMQLESLNYSDLQDFLRSRDNRQAVAEYIIDEGNDVAFFAQFPGLINAQYDLSAGVGDLIKIKKKNFTTGVGLPGDYKPTRQLSGSEAMTNMAARQETMTVGVHRYAVAIRNIVDKKVLPADMVAHIFNMMSAWWSQQDDADTFATLFRDYPTYYAETNSLSAGEEMNRVESLFGRGTYNDINSNPEVIFANSKVNIEPLSDDTGLTDEDTLSDTFVQALREYCQQTVGMPELTLEDGIGFYGLVVDQSDINYFYQNSSATLKTDIRAAFQSGGWKTPIFNNVLGDYQGIRFFKWAPIAQGDNYDALAPYFSVKKGLKGTPINPQGKVLGVLAGNDTLPSGLSVWGGGDVASRALSGTATDLYLLVSSGAMHFPYFAADSATVGADSVNAFTVDATIAGYAMSGASNGSAVGRMQIGDGNTANTRFKVLYTGPVYMGTLQIGANDGQLTFVDDVYLLKVEGIANWDPTANTNKGAFNAIADDAGTAAIITSLEAFLGTDANGVIQNTAAYQTRQYERNRRIHMFDTIRSIVYGKELMYKVTAGGAEYAEENRDYGATSGKGMSVVQGKKIATDGQGLVSNYAIVCFKRPPKSI